MSKKNRRTFCGTLDYLAPEMMTSDYDARVDVRTSQARLRLRSLREESTALLGPHRIGQFARMLPSPCTLLLNRCDVASVLRHCW